MISGLWVVFLLPQYTYTFRVYTRLSLLHFGSVDESMIRKCRKSYTMSLTYLRRIL